MQGLSQPSTTFTLPSSSPSPPTTLKTITTTFQDFVLKERIPIESLSTTTDVTETSTIPTTVTEAITTSITDFGDIVNASAAEVQNSTINLLDITTEAISTFPTTESTSTTMNQIINATVTDMINITPNNTFQFAEATTSNALGIFESNNSSVLTQVMQNGTLGLGTDQNDLTNAAAGNNITIGTTISDIVTSTAENTISIINSTTEKAITILHNITDTTSPTVMNEHHVPFHDAPKTEGHSVIYIILCIILFILILIGVIVLLIYLRYRKHTSSHLQHYYEVNSTKEESTTTIPEEQTRNNDVFVQYAC